MSHFRIIAWVILTGWDEMEAPGKCEEVEVAKVPNGRGVGVGNDAFSCNHSTKTSGEIFVGDAPLSPASFRVYSASIHRIMVEEDG